MSTQSLKQKLAISHSSTKIGYFQKYENYMAFQLYNGAKTK